MTLSGAVLTIAPGFTHAGSYTLTLRVTDGTSPVNGMLSLTISNTNRAPQLMASADVVMVAGTTQLVMLSATDPDGDLISFSAMGLPAWATLIAGVITLSPTAAAAPFDVTVLASDGSLQASDVFRVTVNAAPNQPPTVSGLTQVDAAGTTVATGASVLQAPRVRAIVDDPENAQVQLQVEVVASSAAFTNVPTQTGGTVSEGTLELVLNSLPPGTWKWQVRAVDAGGASSAWLPFAMGNTAFTITPGTVTGSISIAGGANAVGTSTVTLTLSASSTGGAISTMAFSNDGVTFSAPEAFATTRAGWSLSAGDGPKTVFVRFVDVTSGTATVNDSVLLDTVNPTVTGFVINSGSTATASPAVTLSWTASDTGSGLATQSAMNAGGAFTTIMNSPAPWMLSAGEGPKTVQLRVSDNAGNPTTVSAMITLDQSPPSISTVTINDGVQYTRFAQVPIAVTASDGVTSVAEVCFSGSVASAGCVPWGAGGPWQLSLSASEGPKIVDVTVRDAAGNPSTALSVTIRLDTTAPTGTVVINTGDPQYTNQTLATLVLSPSADPSFIAGHCSRSSPNPVPLATDPCFLPLANDSFTLPTGDGPKSVFTYFADLAGNVSAAITDGITLDQTAPTLTATIANAASYTNTSSPQFTLTASDGLSGLAVVCTGVADPPTVCGAYSASPTVTLSAGDGMRTAYVYVRDAAGNPSPVRSDSIIVDTVGPTFTGFTIAGGAAFTNTPGPTFSFLANDPGGLGDMEFSYNGGVSWTAGIPWNLAALSLSGPDGLKTVQARIRDVATNPSVVLSDDILLDQTLPQAPTIALLGQEGSAVATRTANVNVSLTALEPLVPTPTTSGITSSCVRERASSAMIGARPASTDPCFAAYAASFTVTLGAEGSRSVDVWLRDGAGNVAATAATASIILDTMAPAQVTGVSVIAGHRSLRVSWSAPSDGTGSGIANYYVWASRTSGGPWDRLFVVPSTSTTTTLTLANDFTYYVIVAANDAAGNQGLQSAQLSGTPHAPYVETQRFPSPETLNAATTGPGASTRAFFAGTNGQLWSTTDVTNFTRVDAMTDGHVYGIKGDADYVVAVGARGHIAYSSDGLEFRLATNFDTVMPQRDLNDVAYVAGTGGDSHRVAVGNGGLVLRATRLAGAPFAVPQFLTVTSGTTQDLKSIAACPTNSAQCSNGQVLVAVGNAGVILRSSDRGVTWSSVVAPTGFTSASLSKIMHVTGTDTFVAGASASFSGTTSLIVSTNGGQTFTTLTTTPATVNPIRALAYESASVPVRLASGTGSTAQLARLTALAGNSATYNADTFTASPTGLYHAIVRGAGAGAQTVAVGASSNVQRVGAGGTAYTIANTGLTSSWSVLATPRTVAGPVFALASATNILRSTSSLLPVWSAISPVMPAFSPAAATMPSASTLLVVGSGGTIVRSTDANAAGTPTFTPMTSGTTQGLSAIDCLSTTSCMAAGSNGTVLSFNGTSWSTVALVTPTTNTFFGVSMFQDGATTRTIAVGSGGIVYSFPGGNAGTGIPASEFLSGISAHANVAIAVGSSGVYRSTDDGATWTRVLTGGGSSVRHIGGTVFIVVNGATTSRSTDDGLTWTSVPGTLQGSNEIISCTPQVAGAVTRIFIGGTTGSILHSLNVGNGG